MARTPHKLLHLVEADHPAMPPPEGGSASDLRERGGDLSALACASMLDADDASVHAVIARGPPAVMRRAAELGADPVARAPVPFGTPHATANVLRKVVRRCGVRFDACIAWSAFAARVARLTGFGPSRGDYAPLLEADPHRPDLEASRLELVKSKNSDADSLDALATRVFRAAHAPAALPTALAQPPRDGQPMLVSLLADPAASGTSTLAWRGAVLAAAASAPIRLVLPAGCAGARRVGRLPGAGTLTLEIDAQPLPRRLSRAHAVLAVYGPEPPEHASPGLVSYALEIGLPVVADASRLEHAPGWERLADHPNLYRLYGTAPIEIARTLLEALGRGQLVGVA